MSRHITPFFLLAAALSSCQPPDSQLPQPQPPVSVAPTPKWKADLWIGRWEGVEGTYLAISKKEGKYAIEIRDLDKSNVYEGSPFSDGIAFIRKGQTETLHAGSGDQTGMKWLAGKKNCLVIRYGEGYCRD
jgi:hypothetical protein